MEEVENALRPEIPNFKLVKGVFPSVDSLEFSRVSLIHIDVDFGKSITECLNWARFMGCPIIIVDDYGWRECPNVKPAVDDWLEDVTDYALNTPVPQQCWLQKL